MLPTHLINVIIRDVISLQKRHVHDELRIFRKIYGNSESLSPKELKTEPDLRMYLTEFMQVKRGFSCTAEQAERVLDCIWSTYTKNKVRRIYRVTGHVHTFAKTNMFQLKNTRRKLGFPRSI